MSLKRRKISPATGRSENVCCAFQPMSGCEALGVFSPQRFIFFAVTTLSSFLAQASSVVVDANHGSI
jgi:hypothetical protein